MKIKIIAVGKMSTHMKAAYEKYLKKLGYYASVHISEVSEIKNKNKNIIIEKETELILKLIPKKSEVFLCSINGKSLSTISFSNLINNKNSLTFIIGGSHGVKEELFKNKISFSELTFPHQLFRIILLEQLFRGMNINNGGKYHK